MKTAIVGASGALGRAVFERLSVEDAQKAFVLTSRFPEQLVWAKGSKRVEVRKLDLDDPMHAAVILRDCDRVVFCPILTLSGPTARSLRQLDCHAHLVLFSSNNVGIDFESDVYAALRAEEDRVLGMGGGKLSAVRPCMIYGDIADGNVGRLIGLARKLRILPMMGSGAARQQPVHYDDLARLVARLFEDQTAEQLAIAAGGPDVLSMTQMYRTVQSIVPGPVFIITIPGSLLRLLITFFGTLMNLSNAQVRRSETDRLPTWPLLPSWTPVVSFDQGVRRIVEKR